MYGPFHFTKPRDQEGNPPMTDTLIARLESADGPDMQGYVSDRVFCGRCPLEPTAAEAHRKRLIRVLAAAALKVRGV